MTRNPTRKGSSTAVCAIHLTDQNLMLHFRLPSGKFDTDAQKLIATYRLKSLHDTEVGCLVRDLADGRGSDNSKRQVAAPVPRTLRALQTLQSELDSSTSIQVL